MTLQIQTRRFQALILSSLVIASLTGCGDGEEGAEAPNTANM